MDREEGEEEVKTEGKAMGADKTEDKVKVGEIKKEKVRISVILAEKEDTGLENVPIGKIPD